MQLNRHSPSRWMWAAPLLGAALIVACDNSLQGISQQATWGFVFVSAKKSPSGAHSAVPEALFFKGNLSSVPNADFTGDTCADGVFFDEDDLSGVTYLDAGPSIDAVLGGTTNTLSRTSTANGIRYQLSSGSTPYVPGDSIVINVQGVASGFPGGAIRAKTAEAFTFPTELIPPGGSDAIQLNWSVPQDARSAMIVSLRYKASGSPTFNRHVLCAFVDDGVDSIPFRWHQNWSTSAGDREVVATRLRTNYVAAADANLGVISTYQVPTPPNP